MDGMTKNIIENNIEGYNIYVYILQYDLQTNSYNREVRHRRNADSNEDTLTWDYKKYEANYFDFIWASPLVQNIVWQKLQLLETYLKQTRL